MGRKLFNIKEKNSIQEKYNCSENNSMRNIRLIKSVYHGSVSFLITLQKPIRSTKLKRAGKNERRSH